MPTKRKEGVRILQRCQARILIDRRSTSRLRQLVSRFSVFNRFAVGRVASCRPASFEVSGRDDAPPPTRLTLSSALLTSSWMPRSRGCLKNTRYPLRSRHVYQPAISIFKSRYRSRPGLRNIVSRDHVLDQGRVTMCTVNWSRREFGEFEQSYVKFYCQLLKERLHSLGRK